ncbi:bifunctional 3-(3-hydroxy-phenyl)propionate/3-hydroxycinnamic acid hydroxylase [Dactylosporangium sp. CA-052675]|uniref:bifunctional 3-(3-hydroxy-phenyl)propionate/3-hydroxycinnamic acid hydroxylase MhpA n=1 Tax=Dactylosporangium sp. CA-052675 TaxID=3239927 RepID=UPI003D906DA8
MRDDDALPDVDADAVVVGFGPVGQVLTILLAQRGLRVTVVERWPAPYTMPRAVSYDAEAARILAAAGIGDRVGEVTEPSRDYTFKNAAGRTLLHVDVPERDGLGWADSTSVYQPGLEALLAERAAGLPTVEVRRGQEVVALTEHADRVEAEVRRGDGTSTTLTARYVIGCDGANSFVRGAIDAAQHDLGFTHDWLVCDVVLHEARAFKPNNLQVCDPARPRTAVSAGPGHRRWEFMRVPSESYEDFATEASAWRLLSLFDIGPHNATLDRFGVYTTQACYAERWRRGRVLLAGDAAHVMPPFMGQGMSSGFRDAISLTWRLDLILRGVSGAELLDSYESERRAHVQHAIAMSMESGKVICETNRRAAVTRDGTLLAARRRGAVQGMSRTLVEPLTEGVLHAGGPEGTAGHLTPIARVSRAGKVGLFDELSGPGFVVLATGDPAVLLGPERVSFLDSIGATLLRLAPPGASAAADEATVADLDDVLGPWLAAMPAAGVLVRPDFHIFGAADADGLPDVVDDLRRQLSSAH